MRWRATRGLDEAAARVGDRWSLLIVATLVDGPHTFGDLLDELGVAPNVLSRRLKHLEAAQVVAATPYSRRPPRFRYQLTGAGEELAGPLRLLARWGDRAAPGDGLHHEMCGTELEARWYCPTCDQVIADGEADELRYL
jgi:DNA-binding HxlR family transcriptional regulator